MSHHLRVKLARQQIESIQNLRWNAKTERVMKALDALDKEIVNELAKRWSQTKASLQPKPRPKKGKP